MSFWKKVETELEFLGRSRKDLANEIGFDVTTISFGIKRSSIPSADTALKISKSLGVSLEYLLGMSDKKNNSDFLPLQIKEIENILRRFSQKDLNAVTSIVNALNEKY